MVQSGRIKQKYGRKYNKRRSWDLFSYLAKEITTDLKAFKKYNTNSIPGTIHCDVLKHFGYSASQPSGEIPDDKWPEIDKEGRRRWNEILDKMIWSFQEIAEDYPHDPLFIGIKKYHELYPPKEGESLEDFINNKDRPDFDQAVNRKAIDIERDKYRNRIDEGLHLFAEWFENLWD